MVRPAPSRPVTDPAPDRRGGTWPRHRSDPGPCSPAASRLDDLLDDTDGARFWRATDTTLARSVAVHVLADTDPRADALLTAARTSALVTDGHLLRVLDAAAEDGVVYVVNEWGSGVSLDQLLSEGPLLAAPGRLGGQGGRRGDRHRPPQRRRARPAAPREGDDHRGRVGQADRLRRRRGAPGPRRPRPASGSPAASR